MLDDFETREVDTGEAAIFTRRAGAGHPILLLHGFPQTHLMWRDIAPLLSGSYQSDCSLRHLTDNDSMGACRRQVRAGILALVAARAAIYGHLRRPPWVRPQRLSNV
jgi:pimeloyl-ACP methyl ester carboxylesterase